MKVPMGEGRKVLNDSLNIQGFGEMGIRRKNAGKQRPSRDAGMAPQEGGGTTPVLVPCSPSAHARPIGFADYGRCSLNGRSGISAGAVPEEGKRASWKKHGGWRHGESVGACPFQPRLYRYVRYSDRPDALEKVECLSFQFLAGETDTEQSVSAGLCGSSKHCWAS